MEIYNVIKDCYNAEGNLDFSMVIASYATEELARDHIELWVEQQNQSKRVAKTHRGTILHKAQYIDGRSREIYIDRITLIGA